MENIDIIYDNGIPLSLNKLLPEELKRIREQLGLSQKESGLIFGGGINAFNKYESGETAIPKSLDLLFVLLDQKYVSLDDLVKAKQKQKEK